MPFSIVFRPMAEQDLSDIWDYTIKAWSIAQAQTYVQGLSDTIDLLAHHPDMARLRTEFTPPVRLHPFRSHLIIYQTDKTMLEVVRLVHNQSNWVGFLSQT